MRCTQNQHVTRVATSQGGCAAAWVGWEVTVGVTILDKMSDLRQKGVGGGHLRHELRARFGSMCRQERIDEPELEGIVEFEFKRRYKTPGASHETTLVRLRFEQLIRAQSVECRARFEP